MIERVFDYFRTGDTAALLSTLAADFNNSAMQVDGDVIYLQHRYAPKVKPRQ